MVKNFRPPVTEILLAEGAVPKEIQLFRTGKFYHQTYGEFEITPAMLYSMEQNFKNKVRGIDLAVDYKHENDDVAAGWIKSVKRKGNDQLWAEVEWNPAGQKVLAEKEFRYISPEFSNDYQDNETLKKFGPTLLGAGLTNRPTIKGMEPVVQLSEYSLATDLEVCVRETMPEIVKSHPEMDQAQQVAIAYSKCRKKLGIEAQEAVPQQPKTEVKPMDYMSMDPAALDKMSPEQLLVAAKELLSMCKAGQQDMAEVQKAKEAAAAAQKMSEKKLTFTKMLSEGKAVKAQEEAFLADDMVKFAELAAPVNTKPTGDSTQPPVVEETPKTVEAAQDKVLELAEKMAKDKGIARDKAISLVLSENKELSDTIYGAGRKGE